jgi:two-component system sensor histidine kinase/response regulator
VSPQPIILLVDDRPEDLGALNVVVEGLGAKVLLARSGEEALKHVLENDLALILLDMQMPQLDGLETARLVRNRERSRHVPILFLTAYDQDDERVRRAYHLNAVDVVPKPLVADIVRAKVRVLLDLHQLREREREARVLLEHRAAQAERSNADLSLFAHVAAHDLQEPLSTVTRLLRLIERRHASMLPEDAQGQLAQAQTELRRLSALLTDLLDYSRIPAGKKAHRAIPLEEPLKEALRSLKERIDETGARIEHGPLPTLPCDRSQMARLFQNLIGNALKFHGEEPTRVEITAEHSPDGWTLAVADNGLGIPEDARERIFALFERLHPRSTHPGTGLGLSICRRIVESHGGRIHADSRPDGGSVFRFTLPAKSAAAQAALAAVGAAGHGDAHDEPA